ncbi:MAG TPA: zinc ribbon domain-containing protein [Acidisarcina sp.]
MPLYEYRCKACGHRFEKIQTYSAPDEKECPVCKGEVERLISAPSIQFKGSGFYSTDYPSRASKSASAEGASESKSDGKPGDSTSTSSGGATSTDKSSSGEKSSSEKTPSVGDKSSSTPASPSPVSSPGPSKD